MRTTIHHILVKGKQLFMTSFSNLHLKANCIAYVVFCTCRRSKFYITHNDCCCKSLLAMFLYGRWSDQTLTKFIKRGEIQGCWLGKFLAHCSTHSYNQLDHTTTANFLSKCESTIISLAQNTWSNIACKSKRMERVSKSTPWLLWHVNHKSTLQFLLCSSYLIFPTSFGVKGQKLDKTMQISF